ERIGGVHEVLHQQMMPSPIPKELSAEEGEVYRQEVRRRIRILLTKAIGVYESIVATAERIGTSGPFVDRARASLERMKQLLLAEADVPDVPDDPPPPETQAPRPSGRKATVSRPASSPPTTPPVAVPGTGG